MKAIQEESPFMLQTEVAQFLRCDAITVRRWMRAGRLPYIKIGGRVLFRRDEVQAMLDRHTVAPSRLRKARGGVA